MNFDPCGAIFDLSIRIDRPEETVLASDQDLHCFPLIQPFYTH